MKTRSNRDTLILVCAELIRTEVGRRFYEALAASVEDSREELVMAPLEHLPYAQGVARQGTVLLRTLRTSAVEADKIVKAEEAAAHKQRNPS